MTDPDDVREWISVVFVGGLAVATLAVGVWEMVWKLGRDAGVDSALGFATTVVVAGRVAVSRARRRLDRDG